MLCSGAAKKWVGFVSTLDIVVAIVKKLRKEHGGDAGVKAAISEWSHAASIHYFFDTKVSEVMNLSGHNPAAFISRVSGELKLQCCNLTFFPRKQQSKKQLI